MSFEWNRSVLSLPCQACIQGSNGNTWGQTILDHNPKLKSLTISVKEQLADRPKEWIRGTGQQEAVQEQILQQAGFMGAIIPVLGRVMINSVHGWPTIITCAHGRHRSVAVAEITAKFLRDAHGQRVEVYHLELCEDSDKSGEYWRWLRAIWVE